ncbi:Mu transposase C-terminal domain-containing protein [Thermodesulfovibrio thiophilus]|uniref:Mu transposase C-terminal domain-containing protein n=1 Tax=Thermodesulfovibrio thiophilus TaxID=340095 RepID=UPI00042108BE|nr:hypothetical protein [Thermodesulfovibrio thiophilus]
MGRFDADGGYNLLGKGCNQGCNQIEKVVTKIQAFSPKGCNLLQDDIYLTRAEVQKLLGVTHVAILKAIKKNKIKVISTHGNGGKQYRIALSSLPLQAQIKWIQENQEQAKTLPEHIVLKLAVEAQLEVTKLKAPQEEVGIDVLARADEVEKYVISVQKALNVPSGWKKSKWIEKVAKDEGISVRAMYERIKKYQQEGSRAFVRDRENGHLKKWDTQALQYLRGVYLKLIKEGGSGHKKRAYECVAAEAEKQGWRIGSSSSAYMYLQQLNPLLERYAQAGSRGLDNIFYIVRKYDDLEPFECIVGDQHRFDFWIEDKETNRVFRPEGYFFVDLRTRICYGFSLADRYNSYMMGLALRMGLKVYGKFRTAYTDNGKPEVSRYFNEIIKELHAHGMDAQDISELYKTDSGYAVEMEEGEVVEVVQSRKEWHRHARPYNAKAKLIERFFGSLEKIMLDLGVPGLIRELRGTSEEKSQDEKRLKTLKQEGKLLSFEEFLLKLFEAVHIYNNRRHYSLKLSPLQTLTKAIKEGFTPRRIVEKEIDFVLMKKDYRSVNRGRIIIDGILYEGSSLEEGLWDIPDRTRIEVRYDLYERDKVFIVRPDNRIVELRMVPLSSMKDKEKTSELMAWKRDMIRSVKDEYQKLTAQIGGVIEYSNRTKEILKRKKTDRPAVLDPEQLRREVDEKKRLTLEAGQKQYRFQRKTVFSNNRERYQYLIECELNEVEISVQDREFMRQYEETMDETERIWFKNFKKCYQYERRAICF